MADIRKYKQFIVNIKRASGIVDLPIYSGGSPAIAQAAIQVSIKGMRAVDFKGVVIATFHNIHGIFREITYRVNPSMTETISDEEV